MAADGISKLAGTAERAGMALDRKAAAALRQVEQARQALYADLASMLRMQAQAVAGVEAAGEAAAAKVAAAAEAAMQAQAAAAGHSTAEQRAAAEQAVAAIAAAEKEGVMQVRAAQQAATDAIASRGERAVAAVAQRGEAWAANLERFGAQWLAAVEEAAEAEGEKWEDAKEDQAAASDELDERLDGLAAEVHALQASWDREGCKGAFLRAVCSHVLSPPTRVSPACSSAAAAPVHVPAL